jgi:hypothetical protein
MSEPLPWGNDARLTVIFLATRCYSTYIRHSDGCCVGGESADCALIGTINQTWRLFLVGEHH